MLILTTSFKHFTEEVKIPFHNSFQMNFNYGNEGDFKYLPERDEFNSILKNYNSQEFEHLMKIHPRRKVLFSPRFDLSILNSKRNFIFLVFIQDPVNKIICDYEYLSSSQKNFQIEMKRMSLKLYIKKILENKLWKNNNEHRNLFEKQTDFLFYNTNHIIKKNKIKFLNKKITTGNLILLPIENFFECAFFLKMKYKDYFPQIYDNDFKFNNLKKKRNDISSDLLKIIKKKFQDDFYIYEESKNRLFKEINLVSNKKVYKELKAETKFQNIYSFFHKIVNKFFAYLITFFMLFFRPFIKRYFR